MPSVSTLTSDLEGCRHALVGANTSVAAARSLAHELRALAEQLELDALAGSIARMISRMDDVLDEVAEIRLRADAVHDAAAALREGGRTGSSPGSRREALGPVRAHFRPGVWGRPARLKDREKALVEQLVARGASVEVLREQHDRHRWKTPDVIVRWSADDRGTATELKTLNRATDVAVKRNIRLAAEQVAVYGGGDLYIDGREVHLSEAAARQGYARARGEARAHGKVLPRRTHIVLSDERTLTFTEDADE